MKGSRFLLKHQWVHQNSFYLRETRLDAEEEYIKYIKEFVKVEAEEFFEMNLKFEWFKQRYDYEKLIESRNLRKAMVQAAYKEVLEADTEKLNLFFPSLNCPEWMSSKDTSESLTIEKKFEAVVGFPFNRDHVVYIPALSSQISDIAFVSEITNLLSTFNDSESKIEFKTYFADPFFNESHSREVWIVLDSSASAKKLLSLGNGSLNHVEFSFREQPFHLNKLIASIYSDPARIHKDKENSLELARALDKEENIASGIDTILEKLKEEESKNQSIDILIEGISSDDLKAKIAENKEDITSRYETYILEQRELDIVLGYLRKVHLVCYYSSTQFKDFGDMISSSMCPKLRHKYPNDSLDALIRKLLGEETVTNTPKEVEKMDRNIKSLLDSASEAEVKKRDERRENDKTRLDGLKEQFVNRFVEENTIEEGENKFRCNLPPRKLFRGKQFVRKHILSKHKEKLDAVNTQACEAFMKEIFLRDEHKPTHSEEHYIQIGFGRREERHSQGRHHRSPERSSAPVVIEKIVSAVPEAKTRTVVDYGDL